MPEFNYLAFNAQQAYFHDKSEAAKQRLQTKFQRLERKKASLTKEYDALMAEWMYRHNPKYQSMEELCARLEEVENTLVELL